MNNNTSEGLGNAQNTTSNTNMNSNMNTNMNTNMTINNSITNRISSGVQDSVQNLKGTMEDIFNSIKGEQTSKTTKPKSNYMIFIMLFIVSAFILILYFISNQFRTYKALTTMRMYKNYQSIENYKRNTAIQNVSIASSYNPLNVGGQTFDYLNLKVLGGVLRSGARYLEFEIFNSEFGEGAEPVVSVGHKLGEWKLSLNMVSFESVCEFIEENAFTVSDGENRGVPNAEDPLFIGLNLKTNDNTNCLNLINDYILKYWSDRLLGPDYMNQIGNIAQCTMRSLKNKIILFSSGGFINSNLAELINAIWYSPKQYSNLSADIKNKINDSRNKQTLLIRIPLSDITTNFNFNKLKRENEEENRLTIIVPHDEYENGTGASEFRNMFTSNLPVDLFFKCYRDAKCHFICMNYQHLDDTIDQYISIFKNSSFIKKST